MNKDAPCPCGSKKTYEICCGVFHTCKEIPSTAEALMRSRYSAFAKNEIAYLKQTTWPPYQKHFDKVGYLERAQNCIWLGLIIEDTVAGDVKDTKGTVTFKANSMLNGTLNEQRENSLFKKKNGRWYYVKPIE